MKKILVPTDFSGAADSAVKFALRISENFNSEVVLLNSYEIPHSGATMMVSLNDLLQEESVKGLERLANRIGEDYPSTKIKTVSLQGNLENCVEEVIKSHQIDLVVMGTTGATGIEGKLFGSNTANMIRNISAPLIVLPENADIDLPKSIAITTDFKFEVDDAIYNPVREFALGYSSKVNFINVTTSYQEADLQVIEDKFGMDVDFVYNENVEAGIKEYLEQKKVDLLVVVAEKHSIFHNIFKPSHSKMMARELNIPMMILAQ